MALKDIKIAAFQNVIASLPDKPNANSGMTSEQLKSYFDSSPEELRVALNNLIDQAQIQEFGDDFKQGRIIYTGKGTGNYSLTLNGVPSTYYQYVSGSFAILRGYLYILSNDDYVIYSVTVKNENCSCTLSEHSGSPAPAATATVNYLGFNLMINISGNSKAIAVLDYTEILPTIG